MRIALLTDGIYPYVVGGMQRHSLYLAKYLAANGHHVDLYHTNASSKDIHALEVFTDEEKQHIRSFVVEFPKMGTMPGHYIRESYEYARKIYAIYKKQSAVDFIYVKGFAGWELLNQKSKGVKFPPIGLNFHGYEMFQPPASFTEQLKFALLLRSPVKFCVAHADYLFSYGGKITGIIEQLGIKKTRILEIPAGVTDEWVLRGKKDFSGRRKFIFIGRFERRKGLAELYAAIRSLPVKTEATFEFIGDIPRKDRIAASGSYYHGAITDSNELRQVLQSGHVLVCPSRSEGMPNVILEAMASGLPAIATDVGAVACMVNEANGWLLSSNAPEEIKAALLDAIGSDAATLQQKSDRALRDVKEKFLWSQVGPKTVEAIQSCIR